MDSLPLILMVIVLIVGVAMLAGVGVMRRSRSGLDREYFKKQWQMIESYKSNGSPGWHVAIMEADKLLDHALKSQGYSGTTMADRLKDARRTLTNNDAVWRAHKLRNRLAHEQNVPLNAIVVNKALRSFKAGLKDVGAL